ncbi:cysteine-rich receptor-like protein kinase 5 [Cynara cardunculus var. scolymus]|uniref:cysteine-rich receptor-like protein kinase 5 n=1 Tax=Cynara cardunculus var. scolymus TaxID=59895 RepID=UPI000D62F84D|nr:cysteine-rich receptor-like protein kinase 5 [Cynara cardunculus var. scolymus]
MLLSLLLLWIPVLILTATAVEYRTQDCGLNTTSHANNTTYFSNLIQVLQSLASNDAVNNCKFFNKSAGNGHQDVAYGLYLCRTDILPNDCRNCVLKARDDINNLCPFSKEAVVWKDNCMLRYANYSLDLMNSSNFKYACSDYNISQDTSEQTQFWETVRSLMDPLASLAPTHPKEKIAYNELSYNNNAKVYGYVECIPYLSASDCNRCVGESIHRLLQLCYPTRGARVLTRSCNVRFETYKFLQVSAASSDDLSGKKKISTTIIAAIVGAVGALVVIAGIYHMLVKKKPRRRAMSKELNDESDKSEIITEQSLQFELDAIEAATNNFSVDNKIGEGGFGAVYKGVLPDGREIAVKRLSKVSGQGALEFKNEVVLLAKLQHRNLVRLLGFCLEAEEKILIYEYVPNKSLDYFLFDPTKQAQLDWSARYKIIGGIARGMLYLHEDSRLRIIHRDLKASNILLDEDMNPRISDFGTARIFCGNETQAKTNRIVGTFGYMSPEYAMHGNFSVRSDVFSFGVLVLEIISGKRNSGLFQSDYIDLLCHTWNRWKNGSPMDILDSNLVNSSLKNEVLRCINIALLCVQEDAELRPSMASIVLMLNSYSVALPLPQNPPFVSGSRVRHDLPSQMLESDNSICKTNVWPTDVSPITEVQPR